MVPPTSFCAVRAAFNLDPRNAREVQSVWNQKAGPLLGRRVRVHGTLFAGHTGHHPVDLLLIVALIEPLE